MRTRRWLGVILAGAFLLRLLANRLLTVPPPLLDADALWYHSAAESLAAGLGYVHHLTRLPTAEWPPGYPALLAVVYRALGPDPAWAYLLNAAAGTVTCWLAGRIARTLGSDREQLVATALVALLPSHVLFASVVMSETVFTTLMIALVLGALCLSRPSAGTWKGWTAWGIAAGAASLVRAEAVLLLALPLVALVAGRAPWRRIVVALAIVVAAVLVVQLPWLVRNALLFGHVVPVSNSFGRTLLIGHNPVADGGMNLWSPDPDADRRDRLRGDPAADLAVDRRLRDEALRWIAANPARSLELIPAKLWRMYRGDRAWGEWYVPSPQSRVQAPGIEWLGRIGNLFYWPLMLLSVPAFVEALRVRGPHLVLPAVVLLWSAFFAVIFYGSQRFHFPLMPLFCILAAQTLSSLPRRWSPR